MRLTPASTLCIASVGAMLALLRGGIELLRHGQPDVVALAAWATCTTCTALLLASVCARWLDRPVATTAGVVFLLGLHLPWQATSPVGPVMAAAAVIAALAVYAAANVSGYRHLAVGRWTPRVCWLLAGLSYVWGGAEGPACVLATGALFGLWNEDVRSVRYFFDPLGLVLFLLVVWLQPAGQIGLWTRPVAVQPPGDVPNVVWVVLITAPVALASLAWGAVRGYHHVPVWKFVASWTCIAALIAGFHADLAWLVLLWPPLAIVIAAGTVAACRTLSRRRYRRASSGEPAEPEVRVMAFRVTSRGAILQQDDGADCPTSEAR